ncbi:MAG TPA: hypothetical protein VGP72_20735 [Planctomycetota bacterium]
MNWTRNTFVTLGALCACACLWPLPRIFASDKPADDPAALVDQLRSDDFDARRSAADKLLLLGDAARAALEKAVNADDIDVRQAAAALLQKLDKCSLTLLAFDRDGKPASGAEAEIRLYPQQQFGVNWNEPVNSTLTIAPDGTARVAERQSGQIGLNVIWKKWSSAFDPSDSPHYSTVRLRPGGSALIHTLTRGGTASLKCIDSAGKPLKDAQVLCYQQRFDPELFDMQLAVSDNTERSAPSALTDAAGVAKFENLADGCYQVVVRHSDFRVALGPVFRIHEDETLQFETVTLSSKSNGKLTVAILGTDGKPLKKNRVHLDLELAFEGPRAAELTRLARQCRQQIGMRRGLDWPETDDDGKLTVDDLKPGRYSLRVTGSSGEACWPVTSLTIAAGQTLDLGQIKTIQGGSIKGKLLGSDGKGIQYCQAQAMPQSPTSANDDDDGDDTGNRQHMFYQYRMTAQTQADGSYEIRNLAPGTYQLCITARNGQPVLIYGVEVEAGKATAAPDAKVPGPSGNPSKGLKATVLLPDGSPAAGATALVSAGYSRMNPNCDDKGVLDFNMGDQWQPTRLVVRAAECKPCVIDLTAAGVNLSDLKVRLEKQEYGDLRVRVLDDAGQPLAGAIVATTQVNTYMQQYGRSSARGRFTSNKEGIARFNGLAAGQRSFSVEREGFYVNGPVKSLVLPGKENELVVKMRKGLVVRGRVLGPDGKPPANAVAGINMQSCPVDASGRFEFSGLTPGEYQVSARSPGLTCAAPAKVLLKDDGPPASEVKLTLVRPKAAAVCVGADLFGSSAWLMPRGAWESGSKASGMTLSGIFDKAGRAEFLSGSDEQLFLVVGGLDSQQRYYYGSQAKRRKASRVIGAVAFKPLNSVAELKSLPAQDLKMPAADACVSGRLTCEPVVGSQNVYWGQLEMRIIGESAFAIITFNFPSEFARLEARAPVVVGAAPQQNTEVDNFTVREMPAGDYRIVAELRYHRYGVVSPADAENAPPPATLTTFTIRPGQRLKLGTIKYALPPAVVADLKNGPPNTENDAEPDDRLELFQP